MRTIIRQAKEHEFAAVLAFVQRKYSEVFGTRPSSLAPDCIVAVRGEQIVGALTLEFSDGEPFSIEEYFEFDFSALGFGRCQAVSFGRWIADMAYVGNGLGVMGILLAMQRKKEFAFSCATPSLMLHLERNYGLKLKRYFPVVALEKVPDEDRNFFERRPRPGLYIGDLAIWYNTLLPKLHESIELQW